MSDSMLALVYEGPKQMQMREVPIPQIAPDEVLIHVAYSGICGSELSGYEGKNSLRKPPLIMGHEFSGTIERLGDQVLSRRPDLAIGIAVTANPLISCNACAYCLSGRQQLCPTRKLLSAALPGSNAQYVAIRADAVFVLPDGFSLTNASLAEPTACAIHAARLAAPTPDESGLVIGAGPIGLLIIETLMDRGMKTVYCADLNTERLAMAKSLGAIPIEPGDTRTDFVDVAIDAVGASPTRQTCVSATRSGGRIVLVGLHEADSALPINDMVRREITCMGSFAYTPLDFSHALQALVENRIHLNEAWTRIELLESGASCFEELLRGAPVAKIWLVPPSLS